MYTVLQRFLGFPVAFIKGGCGHVDKDTKGLAGLIPGVDEIIVA